MDVFSGGAMNTESRNMRNQRVSTSLDKKASLQEIKSRGTGTDFTQKLEQISEKPLPDVFGASLAPEIASRLKETFASPDLYFGLMLLIQASHATGCFEPIDPKSLLSRFPSAALSAFCVGDGIEALLSVQMVSLHSLAMRFLATAATKDQSEAGIELYMNRANKLLRTFTAQMEALKKHRSTGEQHMTVEHVTVQNGGQAVVGTLNLNSTRVKSRRGDEGQGDNQSGRE
jgi:hypothetical protein